MVDNNVLAVACLLLLSLLWLKCSKNTDGFESKPSQMQADHMADVMLSNKDEFRTLESAKKFMPWIDAITYEDCRRLIREGNFTKQNILTILG
jgi:hypothetical protein